VEATMLDKTTKAMLDKTTNKLTDEPLREVAFYRWLKGFDPAVSGWIFWPILFGMVVLLGSVALRLN
jgi:hypothetical protein